MKKILLATLLSIFLVGCGSPHEYTRIKVERFCPNENIEQRRDFILQCIVNANPLSDEEPEDWMYKCEDMSDKLYCPETTFEITYLAKNSQEKWYDPELKRVLLSEERIKELIGEK